MSNGERTPAPSDGFAAGGASAPGDDSASGGASVSGDLSSGSASMSGNAPAPGNVPASGGIPAPGNAPAPGGTLMPDAPMPGGTPAPGPRKPCCRRRGGGCGALVEPAALAALLFADGYGYDMRKTILERTGGAVDVDVGGLYRSLRRLEEEGAVVSRWCDDEAGPRRREYELTQQGVELAEQWLDVLRDRRRLDELLVGLLEGGLQESGRGAKAQGKEGEDERDDEAGGSHDGRGGA